MSGGRSERAGAPLLVLEASTTHGSVALIDARDAGARAVAVVDVAMGASREDGLFPAMGALLAARGLTPGDLGGVVCGAGPGSFTSLRIAASLAKGVAHGADVPLYAVSSLLLAAAAREAPGEYVVHGDALRGERYCARVRIDAHGVHATDATPVRVPFAELGAFAGARPRLAVVSSPDAPAEEAVVIPHASRLGRVAGWRDAAPVALDVWEPDYGRLAEAQVVWERTHGHALPGG